MLSLITISNMQPSGVHAERTFPSTPWCIIVPRYFQKANNLGVLVYSREYTSTTRYTVGSYRGKFQSAIDFLRYLSCDGVLDLS